MFDGIFPRKRSEQTGGGLELVTPFYFILLEQTIMIFSKYDVFIYTSTDDQFRFHLSDTISHSSNILQEWFLCFGNYTSKSQIQMSSSVLDIWSHVLSIQSFW